jgi:anti-anti-sigma regulatory factor
MPDSDSDHPDAGLPMDRFRELLEATERLAAGDVTARFVERGDDHPLDQLATALNRLAKRVDEMVEHELATRKQLQSEVECRTDELVREIWATRTAEETIDRQEEEIRKLSTPTLPVWDGVVVLPLVGRVSATRGAQVVEQLPRAVASHQASVAIIDLTGVPSVDEAGAAYLLDAASAVRLLGGRVILTGISRENAQTLAILGVDRQLYRATATLREGLRLALRVKG